MQPEFQFVHEKTPVYTCRGVFSNGCLAKRAVTQAQDSARYRTLAELMEKLYGVEGLGPFDEF